jgi:hypothetical protein
MEFKKPTMYTEDNVVEYTTGDSTTPNPDSFWFEDPRLAHLPFHMRGDKWKRIKNLEGNHKLCKKCSGTGNELLSMYKACTDCNGSGVQKQDISLLGEPGYNDIPQGWESVEAYTNGIDLVVLGSPDENHNCDMMGCSSVSHVLYRLKVKQYG